MQPAEAVLRERIPRRCIPLVCRKPEQPSRLLYVLRNALTIEVHAGENGLRRSIPPVCRKPDQPSRLPYVLRNALARVVHLTEAVLPMCIPLVCRKPQQPSRLGFVLRNALARVVHLTEAVLLLRFSPRLELLLLGLRIRVRVCAPSCRTAASTVSSGCA